MNGRTIAEDMEREYQRQSLRDTFAAAALTGLLVHANDSIDDETMDTPSDIAYTAYEIADAMLRERDATTEKASDVRDTRTADTTDLDAAPAARARTDADSDRTDKAVLRPGEGTGDTPVPYCRTDEKRVNWPAIRDTTPLRNGTPAEGSERGEGTEPAAWAVMEPDGFGIEGTFTDRSDATEWCDGRQQIVPLYRHPQPTLTDAEREAVRRLACACETSTFLRDPVMASTLRGLLERMK